MYILIETTTISEEEELKKFLTQNKISFKEDFDKKIIDEFEDLVNGKLDVYNVCKHCNEYVHIDENKEHTCFDEYFEKKFVNDFREEQYEDYENAYTICCEKFDIFIEEVFNI